MKWRFYEVGCTQGGKIISYAHQETRPPNTSITFQLLPDFPTFQHQTVLVCPFSPSSPHQTDNRDKLKEKEEEGWKTGRERERESGGGETRGARPRTPVLMGIISFYLRQLSLHSILISEQRSTVPSKENVCVWKTPSHKQDKRENTYACRLSHPTSALFLEG